MVLHSSLAVAGLLVLAVMGSSCASTRGAVYFPDQSDTSIISSLNIPESVIERNDILSITVSSLNADATAVFNAPNLSFANGSANNVSMVQSSGYLVNADGNIQFPLLGNIQAAGITANQLRLQLVKALVDKKLLVDPIVSVRQLNFKVTVLGEVGHPSVINVPSERITLLEALGFAGDITIYGKRDNVLLIREEGGKKLTRRLNLNSSDIFTSPYYYLRSNDIVYVEPNKAKINSSSRTVQLLPIILSGLSFTAIIVDRLTNKN